MCGRYRLSHRKQIIEAHFDTLSDEDWAPRYNIARTQSVPASSGRILSNLAENYLLPLRMGSHPIMDTVGEFVERVYLPGIGVLHSQPLSIGRAGKENERNVR